MSSFTGSCNHNVLDSTFRYYWGSGFSWLSRLFALAKSYTTPSDVRFLRAMSPDRSTSPTFHWMLAHFGPSDWSRNRLGWARVRKRVIKAMVLKFVIGMDTFNWLETMQLLMTLFCTTPIVPLITTNNFNDSSLRLKYVVNDRAAEWFSESHQASSGSSLLHNLYIIYPLWTKHQASTLKTLPLHTGTV